MGIVRRVVLSAAVVLLGLLTLPAVPEPAPLSHRMRSRQKAVRVQAVSELLDVAAADLRARAREVGPALRRLATRDPEPEVRGIAARALARAMGEDALGDLMDLLARERDSRAAVLLPAAFAEAPTDPARRALGAVAFAERDPRAAALAAECLGALPRAEGREDLLALLETARHWAVTAGACLGLARHRDVRVPPALIARLRHSDAAVRAAARDALVVLCEVDHGVEPLDWESWWQDAGPGYRFPDEPGAEPGGAAPPARDRTTRAGDAADRPTFARFFGIPLTGRRVAFVVDYSQSMWGRRREAAEQELICAVKGLPAGHTFAVVLFNEDVWWFDELPRPALPQQKFDLEAYLPEQETKSYTNIYDALEQALGLLGDGASACDPAPGLDEVVLLSDGVPNRGKLRRVDQILLAIRAQNGGRVRIHTVSLGEEPGELLPILAEQNDGRHVHRAFPK